MKKTLCVLAFLAIFYRVTAQSNSGSSQRDSLQNLGMVEHQLMMKHLGISKLRPGANGNENAPDHANYNEQLANPCPILPQLLVFENGQKVKNASDWYTQRRPEIAEAFENEVYGRIPKDVPAINWRVDIQEREMVGRIPVMARKITGVVDNSNYPKIAVNIEMVLVLPENVKGPVPVLVMFNWGKPKLPAPTQPNTADFEIFNSSLKQMMIKEKPELKELFDKYPAYEPLFKGPSPNFFAPLPNAESPATEQLLAAGWGYCLLDASSIQADNAAGLRQGIIGLVNKGQPRKPDDWGALRAWAWGAARAVDFFSTIPEIDLGKIGIEGVSRYGKAALVTIAFESRFAVGLIGSSGKGGAALHRRDFGEKVENLTGAGQFHWMAGNYLKYAAEESVFGRKTACDLAVDSHQLMAMAAPRLCFISYGIPEKGDAKWLDQKGSFMATVAAGEVYKYLGEKDLGLSNDYLKEPLPPVEKAYLEGKLAWRQHTGGHTDLPNYAYFIPWASQKLGYNK